MANKKKWKDLSNYVRTSIVAYGIVLVAYAILMPLQSLGFLSNAFSGQLVPISIYIVLAISLNLTVGGLGELSLGHAGFMSVGAFSGVVVAVSLQDAIPNNTVRLLLVLIVGGLMAAVAGILIGIPVLRLSGDYLAIVTLAFGEIIKNVINCLYVGVDQNGLHICMNDAAKLNMENGQLILKGPQGAVGVTKIASYTAATVLLIFTLFVVINLTHSRAGRAVAAIRDNRIAAESVGISITKYKMIAFTISASLAGMAGAMYAMNYSTIAAKKFDFNLSILILVFVVLGGMGNIIGSIIATTVLYTLPEILREFSDYRMLIYAIVLIAVMLLTNSNRAKAARARAQDAFKQFLRDRFKKGKGGASDG